MDKSESTSTVETINDPGVSTESQAIAAAELVDALLARPIGRPSPLDRPEILEMWDG